MNVQGGYQDRPTISYVPQTSSQFILNLTQPINPGSVLFLLQSGYPADVVFGLTVESINGVRNQSVSGGQLRPADPAFGQIVQSMRKAQISGHVGIRVDREKEKNGVAMFFHDENIDPELAAELADVRKILRLDPDRSEFRVAFGATAANPEEIAILSRSVLRILSELSTFVHVPCRAPCQWQCSGCWSDSGSMPNRRSRSSAGARNLRTHSWPCATRDTGSGSKRATFVRNVPSPTSWSSSLWRTRDPRRACP